MIRIVLSIYFKLCFKTNGHLVVKHNMILKALNGISNQKQSLNKDCMEKCNFLGQIAVKNMCRFNNSHMKYITFNYFFNLGKGININSDCCKFVNFRKGLIYRGQAMNPN